MSSKSSFTFKNPMLNLLARWSGGKKLGVFFLWMLLIIPIYMLFEQTGGNVPAWVQSVLLGADVVLSMNYIVCVLISALHDPLRSEDHLFSGISSSSPCVWRLLSARRLSRIRAAVFWSLTTK
jgi:hypothetical protein